MARSMFAGDKAGAVRCGHISARVTSTFPAVGSTPWAPCSLASLYYSPPAPPATQSAALIFEGATQGAFGTGRNWGSWQTAADSLPAGRRQGYRAIQADQTGFTWHSNLLPVGLQPQFLHLQRGGRTSPQCPAKASEALHGLPPSPFCPPLLPRSSLHTLLPPRIFLHRARHVVTPEPLCWLRPQPGYSPFPSSFSFSVIPACSPCPPDEHGRPSQPVLPVCPFPAAPCSPSKIISCVSTMLFVSLLLEHESAGQGPAHVPSLTCLQHPNPVCHIADAQ